jgi:hypothetical protein
MSSTTTLKQSLLFEPSFDPCYFSLDNTFKALLIALALCLLYTSMGLSDLCVHAYLLKLSISKTT